MEATHGPEVKSRAFGGDFVRHDSCRHIYLLLGIHIFMRGASSFCELALDIIADRHEGHRKRAQRLAHVDGIALYAAELQSGEGLVQRIRLRRELRSERCLGDMLDLETTSPELFA